MGQRLNIEITDGEYVLANCGYLDAAYSEFAIDILECIVNSYENAFSEGACDLYTAVQLLEMTGAGVTGAERKRILSDESGLFDGIRFAPARGASQGWIAVTEIGIKENRRWEKGRAIVNLRDQTIGYHVHYYTYEDEYKDFADRVPGTVPYEELPIVKADPDIFTNVYFDHLEMVRKIIEQCPYGFRLLNGDVIEWM